MEKELKQECIVRMHELKLSNKCINAFIKGKVWCSDKYGMLFELNEEEQEIVNNFEKEHENSKVYHITHSFTEFGELYNILYVSPYKEEWEEDRAIIKENYVFAYVYNKDSDFCSEFGEIQVKNCFGGLVRIG